MFWVILELHIRTMFLFFQTVSRLAEYVYARGIMISSLIVVHCMVSAQDWLRNIKTAFTFELNIFQLGLS